MRLIGKLRANPFALSLAVLGTVVGSILAAGCGGDSGPPTVLVSGQVTLDGQPVEEGQIYFRAQDGGNSYAGKIENGRYETEVTPGGKRIEIIGHRIVPGKFREDNPGEKTPVREMYIPQKYNRNTTLEIELPADVRQQEEDFLLTS